MLTMNDKPTPKSTTPPDPEVSGKAKRRKFSAAFKLAILEEVDKCTEIGEIGALLRREGLYSSHLTKWRRERELGALAALSPKKRGPKGKSQTPETLRIAELERENRRLEREKGWLEAKLKRADLMLEIQKKTSELLGISLEELANDGSNL